MTPSDRIATFIQGYEACARRQPDGSLHAYMPTPDDVPTIGYGSTGPDIKMGTVWTQALADARFHADLAKFGRSVELRLARSPTTQAQFDAMVSLAYNIGDGNFSASSVLRQHKAGDYASAAAHFADWNKQRDNKTGTLKVLDGLTKRRAAEAAIYRAA